MVQHRYGYTDEYVLSLPYARFMDMVETISKIKAEELREEYRQAAFASYLSGAGKTDDESLTFAQYLKRIGLAKEDTEDASPPAEEVTKEEALAKAQNILATYRFTAE